MATLYFNGKIITMEHPDERDTIDFAPEAVLIDKGKIKGVGTISELEKMVKKVKRVDLKGKCLMPAFIDSHSHIAMNGQMSMCAQLGDCESFQDIINTLKHYMEDKKIKSKGAVLGFGYDHNFLKEQRHPDKRVLDQVSTEVPIFILHVSAHLACANSKALELAGITPESADPEGGAYGRLEDGKEPSGYMEEAGMSAIQQVIQRRIKIDIKAMLRGMQSSYIRNGVTTVQDGATTQNDFRILKAMAFFGKLKVDVAAYPLLSNGGQALLHRNHKYVRRYRRHLKIGGYKIVLDGSPQGRSAWMSEPYLGGEEGYCAYSWMQDEQVEDYVRTAIHEKQQILAHCNGDAASEQFLRAYWKIMKENKVRENFRPVMIHCQTVRKDQLERMAKIKMIASIFVGHVFYWGDIHMKNLGERRGRNISPAGDALKCGVVVNFHQDTPVTKPDMMHSVWAAVNRISRNGSIIGEEQRISVYEALKAVTINGAYQYFEENSKGSIKAGKRADLVILDRSPLEVEKSEIRTIKVCETIKDGKVIYRRHKKQ